MTGHGLPILRRYQDGRFLSLSSFFFKLPTTQTWEKINLLGQWWTTLQKIQKISKLIKTHVYYPEMFFPFSFLCFSFSLFLSLFPSCPFFSIFIFCLISPKSNTPEPDRWLWLMMDCPLGCANSSLKSHVNN